MESIKFSEKIIVNFSTREVFDFTQDYSRRLEWDTFLKKALLVNGATEAGIGIKAWCVNRFGFGMETEYVSFNPPHAVAVKMTKGPMIFKSFLGSWVFNEINMNTTEVIFLYSFQLRSPFNLATWVIKKYLQEEVKQRLKNLKLGIESMVRIQ